MKQPINEKLSTAAAIAVVALINSRISGLKDEVKSLKKATKTASTKTDDKVLQKQVATLEKTIADMSKKVQTKSDGVELDKANLDKIRKLVRKEVGRILFDIYKLRNSWTTT